MIADHRPIVRSPLALRLVAAFVAVAVAAVFVLAGLTLWRTRHTVGRLADERQQATADAIAQTLALGYQQDGGWDGTDPHPAMMVAVQAGASLTVLDAQGSPLLLRSRMGNLPVIGTVVDGVARRAPVVADGRPVGTAVVTFTRGELGQAERHVRDALSGAVLIGAVSAALVALAVAVPLAGRVVRPLSRMTTTARRLGDGDASARVDDHDAPGELGTLARTFDEMAERLEAHETTRRNVAADVAHELRTPLTLLQGSCEEVIDGIAAPDLDRFVQLHDDILRLRRLVDDLGTLADADAAATEPRLHHVRCDLAAVAAQVADSLAPLLDAHQHTLNRHLESVEVRGDPARLAQVVANLLTNAIKFTPAGGRIDLDVRPVTDGTRALLTARDNGPGIDPADRPHVFERFYRAGPTRHIAGSGIGLAVVHQLVTAHGGTLTIDDAAPGATFVVTLPTNPLGG